MDESESNHADNSQDFVIRVIISENILIMAVSSSNREHPYYDGI